LDLLARLMDDEPVRFQEMALLKPPGGGLIWHGLLHHGTPWPPLHRFAICTYYPLTANVGRYVWM
jgi:hypothetical protein